MELIDARQPEEQGVERGAENKRKREQRQQEKKRSEAEEGRWQKGAKSVVNRFFRKSQLQPLIGDERDKQERQQAHIGPTLDIVLDAPINGVLVKRRQRPLPGEDVPITMVAGIAKEVWDQE